VYSFSYKFLKSKQLAQDCTQLAFIKIWERRDQLNCDLNFKSYLFTICKNSILKTIEKTARENKFKELVMQEYANEGRHENSELEHLEKVAQEALEQLPPQRQLIFKLCKIEGQSYNEVALNLGISNGTVRDHMFKASKSIKRFLLLHKVLGALIVYWIC
jgi:RNA polymerase sigma-70 factor (ECF subfamily)